MPRTCCIVGGSSHLGYCLANELLQHNFHVINADIKQSIYPVDGVKFVQIDVLHLESLVEAFSDSDVVCHLVSYGMSGQEMMEKVPVLEVNVEQINGVNIAGTENVVAACLSCNVTALVYASSVNVVFGGQVIEDGDENLPYWPLHKHVDSYSRSKTIAEKLVLQSNNRKLANDDRLATCALRFNGIYGPHDQRHLPRIISSIERGLFCFTYGQGRTSLVQYSSGENCAQAFRLAAENLLDRSNACASGKAYFIVDGPPLDSFEMFKPLCIFLNRPFPKYRIPFTIMYYLALIFEIIHNILSRTVPQFDFEPLLTRTEILKMGVTHHFKIDRAIADLESLPVQLPESHILFPKNRFFHTHQKIMPMIDNCSTPVAVGASVVEYSDSMSLDNPLKSTSDYDDMFFSTTHDSFGSSLSSPLSDGSVSMVDYKQFKPFDPMQTPDTNQHRLSTSSNASSGYCSSFDVKMETPDSTDDSMAGFAFSNHQQPPLDGMLGQANPGGEMDTSMEIYRELILRHLIQDIQATCNRLSIHNDPEKWGPAESVRWIEEMTGQFQLGTTVNPNIFALPGRLLCQMTNEEFTTKCPEHGDTLHAQLQIWKTASEYSQQLVDQQTTGMCLGNNDTYSSTPNNSWRGAYGLTGGAQCSNGMDAGCSYSNSAGVTASAPEWLAGFDPMAGGAEYSNNNVNGGNHMNINHQRGYVDSATGLSVQTYATNGLHFAHNAHLLDSPCGSDSGVSSDFEDGGDGSPGSTVLPGSGTGTIHLWQFIRELLDHPDRFRSCVRWLDRTEGLFKIEDSHKLARLWGQRKNRTKMNYDKLSRSLRQYYKKNIIRKTGQRQRLIYQFVAPYHLL